MVASACLPSACTHSQPSPLLLLHFCNLLSSSTQHLSCTTPTPNGAGTGLCSATTASCLGGIQNWRLGYKLWADVSRLDHCHRNSRALCVPLLVGPTAVHCSFLDPFLYSFLFLFSLPIAFYCSAIHSRSSTSTGQCPIIGLPFVSMAEGRISLAEQVVGEGGGEQRTTTLQHCCTKALMRRSKSGGTEQRPRKTCGGPGRARDGPVCQGERG